MPNMLCRRLLGEVDYGEPREFNYWNEFIFRVYLSHRTIPLKRNGFYFPSKE